MGKLSGIKVVDLSQFLPGPMLSMMMADQGADVIKVEPATGDPARAQAPFENGHSLWFANLNRGKSSLVLDLKNEAGKAELRDLVRSADVFVEGFRPGVMARLGFGWAEVRALNPRLVYCSISAFGQTGALAQHPAHDMAVQAMAGFISVNAAGDGSRPVVPGVPAADVAAGLTGLAAVLMALIGREKTGQGDYLDIAMFDSLLPWSAHIAGSALAGGPSPQSAAQRSLGGAAFYNIYSCADGRHIVLGGRELKFATSLLTALGRPDLIALAQAEAGEPQAPLIAFLRDVFRTRTRDEWDAFMHDIDVAYAPVLDFAEAFAQPHIAERGLIVTADGRQQIAPAIRFAGEAWVPGPVPELGQG